MVCSGIIIIICGIYLYNNTLAYDGGTHAAFDSEKEKDLVTNEYNYESGGYIIHSKSMSSKLFRLVKISLDVHVRSGKITFVVVDEKGNETKLVDVAEGEFLREEYTVKDLGKEYYIKWILEPQTKVSIQEKTAHYGYRRD